MVEKFCTTCGHERVQEEKFCGNCGTVYSASTEVAATLTSNGSSPINNQSILNGAVKRSRFRTLPNILVNIVIAILLLMFNSVLERQVSWGGGESFLMVLLLLVIGLQVLTLVLQKRNKSYSLLLPTAISLISIFPTLSLFNDFKRWLGSQGYQTQAVAGGDLSLILMVLFTFLIITVLNIIFLFVRNKK
ncbi:zinc ribbon domain-containing protein [Bacillus sp. JJ1566]|uniref:zinc ribbon domain-containing protein n=1 Tax=Bacillus sp. JJ1566 TaxID=3122961 RepID=UPI002FFFEF7E